MRFTVLYILSIIKVLAAPEREELVLASVSDEWVPGKKERNLNIVWRLRNKKFP